MFHAARAGVCALAAGCALAGTPAAGAASAPPHLPPQGVYDWCAPARSPDGCAGRLQRIGQAGFRAVVNGTVFNDISEQRIRAYAQQAANNGLKVIWPFNSLPFQNADPNGTDLLAAYPGIADGCNCSDNRGLFAHLVGILRGMPNTWGYYLADEPGPSAHASLLAWVARVKALDPNHPRLIMGCGICGGGDPNGSNISWMGDLDVALGTDAYPVVSGASDPQRAYNGVAQNVASVDRVATRAGRQQVVALQSWRWGDSAIDAPTAVPDPAATRFPTRDEIEAQRNAAMENAHPDLILWFTLTQVIGWEPGQSLTGWYNPPDTAQRWANLAGGAFAPARTNARPHAGLRIRRKSHSRRGNRFIADAVTSRDPDGRIVRYRWTLNGRRLVGCRSYHRCDFGVRRGRVQRLAVVVTDDRGASGIARRSIFVPLGRVTRWR
jgi:hypothetical protein